MSDFSIEKINESAFEGAMSVDSIRTETWLQAAKDFNLSGISNFPQPVPSGLNEMINLLTEFMKSLQSKSQNWDSLNYRVDLPASLLSGELSPTDYSRLILFRCFQKVWLRQEFSNPSKERLNEPL